MKGMFVTNGFYKSESFNDIYLKLKDAFNSLGVEVDLFTNTQIIARLDDEDNNCFGDKYSFCIFWNKDILLAKAIESMGIRVFNSSKAIEVCDNKALTHFALKGKVKMPKTYHIPQTYKYIGYNDFSFLKNYEEKLGYPYIIKECMGSFGSGVHMVLNFSEAIEIIKECGVEPMIAQEYIRPVKQSEYSDIRAYMVGDKCVACMERYSESDFRVNIGNGGQAREYHLSDEELKLCQDVVRILGLDFCGVDILHSEYGPILCEVNSNAQYAGLINCSGIDPSMAIAETIIERIKDNE